MGLLSSIWKGIKNVFKGIMKVFSPILKPIAKILNTKWGKALMLAISVFTMGTALMAGGAAFSGAQAAGQGFLQSFVEGGKAFVKTLFGMGGKEGAGGAAGGAAEGALPAAQEVAQATAVNPMATNMAGAEAATAAGATAGGNITEAIGQLAGSGTPGAGTAALGDTAGVLGVGGGAGGAATGGGNLLSQGAAAGGAAGGAAAGGAAAGGAAAGGALPTAGAVTPTPLQTPISAGAPGGPALPSSAVPDASSVGKLVPELAGTGNAAQTAAAFTPKQGNWLSKAASKAWEFIKSDEGKDLIGSSLEGLWDAERDKAYYKHHERYDRMWRNPNDPGNRALSQHDYYTRTPGWPGSDQSGLINRRNRGYTPSVPYRRAPQGAGG